MVKETSSEPREFVQRQRRILRQFSEKTKAEVYDFVMLLDSPSNFNRDLGKSLLRREMPRCTEFASSALNEFETRAVVGELLDYSGMLPSMDGLRTAAWYSNMSLGNQLLSMVLQFLKVFIAILNCPKKASGARFSWFMMIGSKFLHDSIELRTQLEANKPGMMANMVTHYSPIGELCQTFMSFRPS